MVSIGKMLCKSYDEVSINKLLYGNIAFYKRTDFWIGFTFVAVFLAVSYFFYEFNFSQLGYLIFFSILTVLFGLIFNEHTKNRMKANNILTDRSLLKNCLNDNYHEKRLRKFHETLKDNSLLNGTNKDINIISGYVEFLNRESGSLRNESKEYLLTIGFLAFLFSHLWIKFIDYLAGNMKKENIASIFLIFMIAVFILFILFKIYRGSVYLMNKKSIKYNSICKLLEELKINLEIKNN